MSYIIKTTSGLINTILTDAARKNISQGNFKISYFQVGDSEVCYNCISGQKPTDLNILMPQYNAQNTTPAPESNRLQVKYPLYVDSTSGSTYGIPYDSSFVDNIFNSAAHRGFFTGNSLSYSAFTSSAYTITPNFIVDNTTLNSGTTLVLSANTLDITVSGTVTPGMILNLFTNNSVTPLSGNAPLFTYVVVGVTGDTFSASTVTIEVDRQLPDFLNMGYTGNSIAIFYPSGMTALYDSVTPAPYWATNVINFETNCDLSQSDVKIWNMNIPWTESPAGLFNSQNLDYNNFSSSGYVGSKEYFGYNSDTGQVDTGGVYFVNSMGQKITLNPSDSKAVAILHYTNQAIDNFYGEKFAQQEYDATNPGGTGQARNFKISIPWLMWHKNPNGTIGEEFFTDPSGFTSIDLFQVYYIKSKKDAEFNNPGIRYYYLWDTHPNTDGYPNRVGKVFPDLKMIAIDDEELSAAMSYKSNRNYTLPAPRLGLVVPNTFNQNIAATSGILTGDTETMFVTYRFENTGSTNGLHCNYYSKIAGSTVSGQTDDVIVRFGNEFPFLIEDMGLQPSGFTCTNVKLICQIVPTGERPDSMQWREIDVTSAITANTGSINIGPLEISGTTFQITKDEYDNASFYRLENYIELPLINYNTGMTFGDEYFFYGTVHWVLLLVSLDHAWLGSRTC